MATNHKGRPLHAGKRTADEMYAQIKKNSSWFDDSYRNTGSTAGYPHTDKYDREGFAVDTTPYEANDPMGA